MKRLRVWFAALLLRGTECSVARTSILTEVKTSVIELVEFVQKSGAMPDSSHIRAYRHILRESSEAAKLVEQLMVRV